MKKLFSIGLFLFFIFIVSEFTFSKKNIIPGIEQISDYSKYLQNKNIAIVSNHSSVVKGEHIVDILDKMNINVLKIFTPEHGFSGSYDAGKFVNDSLYLNKIPIISLYGKNKKPNKSDLKDIEILLFDLQDIGVRFYTYISTLHFVMEACAENDIPILILDRPNPNIDYIDGPILKNEFNSFVGIHPVPIVYGMTILEYANMINGEYWLSDSVQCEIIFQKILNYNRNSKYILPIKPSPNLPNYNSIRNYPSLALFEGTDISVGRGTNLQFQIFGSPKLKNYKFNFTPSQNSGSLNPKYENQICYGIDLRNNTIEGKINLNFLIDTYNQYKANKLMFFNSYFNKLVGDDNLKNQIEEGFSAEEIRKSWESDLINFKKIRKKYLLYD